MGGRSAPLGISSRRSQSKTGWLMPSAKPKGSIPSILLVSRHSRTENAASHGGPVSSARDFEPPLPIENRLADAVGKTEGFDTIHIAGIEALQDGERGVPWGAGQLSPPLLQAGGRRIDHREYMRHVSDSAPEPGSGRIGADVAEAARTCLVASHAGEELGWKPGEDGCRSPQRPQSVGGEGKLQRPVRQRIAQDRIGHRSLAEPFPRRGKIGNAQQVKARRGQMPLTESRDALDIIEFRPAGSRSGVTAYSRLSHSRISSSVMDNRSMPSRIRELRIRSKAVRPG